MSESAPCKFLVWDSDFFNLRIGRITSNQLDAHKMDHICSWAIDHKMDCLYFLTDSEDDLTRKLALEYKFLPVDKRLVFSCQIEEHPIPKNHFEELIIRPSKLEDLDKLSELASQNHRDSRFYQDPHFSQKECDHLFGTWIRNSCAGYADIVLVLEFKAKPVGYCSFKLGKDHNAEIDLFGIDLENQGQGLALALLNEGLNYLKKNGVKKLQIITQDRNKKAVSFYKKNKFSLENAQAYYHYWLK